MIDPAVDRRVARRVKRINKKIEIDYPLFASLFHTTPEIEAKNLERIDRSTADAQIRMVQLNARHEIGARFLQLWATDILETDEYRDAVRKLRRLMESFPVFRTPTYRIDYWRQVVRGKLLA